MEAALSRTQTRLIVAGYSAVAVASAGLLFMRYLQYALHPQDADKYGTMWAFGDWILGVFIAGLFLLPTVFLAWTLAKSEAAYTTYAKVVLGISLTAPLSTALLSIPAVNNGWLLGGPCLYRLLAFPAVVMLEGFSYALARFPRPKKLTLFALLIEIGTLVFNIGSMFVTAMSHHK